MVYNLWNQLNEIATLYILGHNGGFLAVILIKTLNGTSSLCQVPNGVSRDLERMNVGLG